MTDILARASDWLSQHNSDHNEYNTRTLVQDLFDKVVELRSYLDEADDNQEIEGIE